MRPDEARDARRIAYCSRARPTAAEQWLRRVLSRAGRPGFLRCAGAAANSPGRPFQLPENGPGPCGRRYAGSRAGRVPRLTIANLAGEPGRCIAITAAAGDRPAIIFGQIGNRTVEIIDFELHRPPQSGNRRPWSPWRGRHQGPGVAASCHTSHRSRRQPDHWRRSDPADRWHYDQDPDLELGHPPKYDPFSRYCALSRRFRTAPPRSLQD